MDAALPVTRMRSLEAVVAANPRWAGPRFLTILLTAFAGTALLLALAGVYGVTSFSVAQRRHEAAIRLALGASPRQVIRLVVRQSIRPMGAGLMAGLGISIALARVLESHRLSIDPVPVDSKVSMAVTYLLETYLFGIMATDTATFAIVAITLALLGILANLVPVLRLAALAPLRALRYE